MKIASILFFLLLVSFSFAQFSSGKYTLYYRGNSIFIKENISGKSCHPASCEVSFQISSQVFKATEKTGIQRFIDMIKPKDKIFLDKIIPSAGCITLPSHIVIEI